MSRNFQRKYSKLLCKYNLIINRNIKKSIIDLLVEFNFIVIVII